MSTIQGEFFSELPPPRCAYCNAPLVSGYYFCVACATPHSRPDSVLPAVHAARLTDAQLIRRKVPQVWTVFWTFLGVVLLGGALSTLLAWSGRPDVGMLLGTVALLTTTAVFSVRYWRSLAVQLRRFGFLHWAAWIGLLLLAPLLGANWLYHVWLLERLGIPSPGFDALRDSGLISRAGLIVLICVFPAVLEEIAFRGLVQHWLLAAIPPLRAVALASALFMLLHFSLYSAPYLFAAGMLMGWTRWKTGSLYPSMVIHFLHNLAVVELFGA